jgi:hypothetical protein
LKTSLLPSKATDSTSAHVKRQPKAGHTLSAVDVNEISNRLVERDGLLRMYQKLLIEKEQRLRDFVNTHQSTGRPAAVQALLSWRFVMALRRFRYRLLHPSMK